MKIPKIGDKVKCLVINQELTVTDVNIIDNIIRIEGKNKRGRFYLTSYFDFENKKYGSNIEIPKKKEYSIEKIYVICRQRRIELGLSQRELTKHLNKSKKLNFRPATISDFEAGKHCLNSETLQELLRIIQIDLVPKPVK